MMDGMLALLTYQAGHYFATGEAPVRTGNRHPQQTPYETFATRDGFVIIGAGSQRLWEKLCTKVLNRSDFITDPRFLTLADRNRNQPQLKEIIDDLTATEPTDEWIDRLNRAQVPCGKVRTVKEALELEQTRAREMVVEMEDRLRGRKKLLGIPTKLSENPGQIRMMPPMLGEHTEAILLDLGYSRTQIEAWEEEKVVRRHKPEEGANPN
jgi:crotonobetainyl-CoA:carnitine CoA-transferase CaiB-like acyl-CoA transferase